MVNPPLPSGNVTPLGAPGYGNLNNGQGRPAGSDRGPDYVYFERKPAQFGETIAQKSTAAKMRLELYYKETVEGVVGRKERYVAPGARKVEADRNGITRRRTTLEKQLAADHETPDHMKHRQLQALGRRESKYVISDELLPRAVDQHPCIDLTASCGSNGQRSAWMTLGRSRSSVKEHLAR